MKLKIKVKILTKNITLPKVIWKGDWIDLKAAENVHYYAPQAGVRERITENGVTTSYRNVSFSNIHIPLGVAMKLPEGLEAVLLPRSSTYDKYGIILANSEGIIDYTYSGNKDEWKFNAIALREGEILAGTRFCQFRIQLSQKATFWQKVKWFFSNGIEIVEVDSLDEENRGGFGEGTGE